LEELKKQTQECWKQTDLLPEIRNEQRHHAVGMSSDGRREELNRDNAMGDRSLAEPKAAMKRHQWIVP
jgi:hypothetical protein